MLATLLAALLFSRLEPALGQNLYNTGFENFTTNNWQGWISDNGVWQVGTPPPTSGPGAAFDGKQCAGTSMTSGSYPASTNSRLISPPINLPTVTSGTQILLTYWQWYSWGDGGAGGLVQVSTNGGGSWSSVSNPVPYGNSSYFGVSVGWSPVTVDLSGFAGKQIQIAFQHTGSSGGAPGWYVDDVSIDQVAMQGLPLNQSFESFSSSPPNQNWYGWNVDNGIWQVGQPSNGPGSALDGVQCAGTSMQTDVSPASQASRLISPAISLPAISAGQKIILTFWQWFKWGGSIRLGGVQVAPVVDPQFSGGGLQWASVNDTSAGFKGNSGGWSLVSVDLSTYAGQGIYLAFQHLGVVVTDPGWYIDDVNISVQNAVNLPLNQIVGFEDFSNSSWDGWYADNGVWQVGAPAYGPGSAATGSQCAGTAMPSGSYPVNQTSRLVSPPIQLPAIGASQQITLTFHEWFNWDASNGTGQTPGSGVVQVSTWVPPANYQAGYWSTWTPASITYTGSSAGWVFVGTDYSTVYLSAYAGKTIRIGFLQTGGTKAAPGWYIDDVTVTLPPPAIVSFTPTSGPIGTTVTVNGSMYDGAYAVAFNGVQASFSNVTGTSLTAIVPSGATTGQISVTTRGGKSISSTNFTVVAPTANNQTVSTAHATAKAITLTGSDYLTPPTTLAYAIASPPSHGTLGTLNSSTGAVTYTPNSSYQGTDSFTFTVMNANNAVSPPGTVTIKVGPGTPTASGQTVQVTGVTTLALVGTDPDVPALPLTYTIATQPTHGAITNLNPNSGGATYTPTAGYQGSDSFTFTVSNGVNSSAPATVSLIVPVTISAFTLSPTAVYGGSSTTGTVTLTAPAPTGGLTVLINSSNTSLVGNTSISVPAGQSQATFTLSTPVVTTTQTVTITTALNGSTPAATLTVLPIGVKSVSLSPSQVVGSLKSTGTITLQAPAPAGGLLVTIVSSNPLVANATVKSLMIPQGAVTGNFPIATAAVASQTLVTFTATANAVAASAPLTVLPIGVQLVTVVPGTIKGGAKANGMVTLQAQAAPGNIVVTLTSSNPSILTVPATVTVTRGMLNASFLVSTSAVSINTIVTITATVNNTSQSTKVTLTL